MFTFLRGEELSTRVGGSTHEYGHATTLSLKVLLQSINEVRELRRIYVLFEHKHVQWKQSLKKTHNDAS